MKTEEMSFQVLLGNCQGLSIPDRGGKLIPPARNGEWKRSGTWFCASLWWHHEASLTRRSQASGGNVDCHQWVEVGCWACGCSICKHQFIELDASCNREPVQGDKEMCDMFQRPIEKEKGKEEAVQIERMWARLHSSVKLFYITFEYFMF